VTAFKQLPVAFDILPGNFRVRRHKDVSLCGLKDHSTQLLVLVVSVFVLMGDIDAQEAHEHRKTSRYSRE